MNFRQQTVKSAFQQRNLDASSRIASAEGHRELEPPDVRKLARLAQIRVTDEEVSKVLIVVMSM